MTSGATLLWGERGLGSVLVALALALGMPLASTASAQAAKEGGGSDPNALPIVFVHGGSGSAAQYQAQSQRWASNGYPKEVAGIDRTTSNSAVLNPILDEFFDDVMERNNTDQVYVVGHSLGVALMNNYLDSSPERTARVAKYIGVDSASAGAVPVCPGTPDPVPCMGIYRTENAGLQLGDDNVYLEEGHVEAASSPDSFAHQYEFFTGKEPKTTLVLPEPPGEVEVSGRLIDFPANTGIDGSSVRVFQVNPDTGARQILKASINLDASGEFGPVKLNGNHPHEFEVTRDPASGLKGHVYTQPFIRDSNLFRLLTAPPGSPSLVFTNASPNHSAAVVLRNKEWWSTHSSGRNDTLEITTDSASRGTEAAGNILTPATGNGSVGIHVHDAAATPEQSTLNLLPVIPLFPFQTGVDVFMPATDPPDGVIRFENAPRGDTDNRELLNVPNWGSDAHRLGVYFNDYNQEIGSWGECKRAKPSPC